MRGFSSQRKGRGTSGDWYFHGWGISKCRKSMCEWKEEVWAGKVQPVAETGNLFQNTGLRVSKTVLNGRSVCVWEFFCTLWGLQCDISLPGGKGEAATMAYTLLYISSQSEFLYNLRFLVFEVWGFSYLKLSHKICGRKHSAFQNNQLICCANERLAEECYVAISSLLKFSRSCIQQNFLKNQL